MDAHRFDQLARALATGKTRRQFVRGLAALATGGLLGGLGSVRIGAHQESGADDDPAEQPPISTVEPTLTPTPTPTAAVAPTPTEGVAPTPTRTEEPTPTAAVESPTATPAADGDTPTPIATATPDGPAETGDEPTATPDPTATVPADIGPLMEPPTPTACPRGETACPGVCTDLATDPANCGACGSVCPSGTCANASCVPTACPDGTLCGATCCGAGYTCTNGACRQTTPGCLTANCPAGQECAGGVCCPHDRACGAGLLCCEPDQTCAIGEYGGFVCCSGDACSGICSDERICGTQCCAASEICVTPANAESVCCDSKQACGSRCCPDSQSCVNGTCRCPAGTTPRDDGSGSFTCCASAEVCGDGCCKTGDVCLPRGCCKPERACGVQCCYGNEVCENGECLHEDQRCGAAWCRYGEVCIGGACRCPTTCAAGESCALNVNDALVCCAIDRIFSVSSDPDTHSSYLCCPAAATCGADYASKTCCVAGVCVDGANGISGVCSSNPEARGSGHISRYRPSFAPNALDEGGGSIPGGPDPGGPTNNAGDPGVLGDDNRDATPTSTVVIGNNDAGMSTGGIYVVNADGSGLTRLASDAFAPVWSANGAKIAFAASDGVAVMNADGTGRRLVARSTAEPVWSPDGTMLAFVAVEERVVYVIGSDGAVITKAPLLDADAAANAPVAFIDQRPSWSPDGSRLAFVAPDGNGQDVYAITLDGTRRANLTGLSTGQEVAVAAPVGPTWSPDGSMLAYGVIPTGDQNPDVGGIEVVLQDGSGRRRLTDITPFGGPTWSPDGTRLLFASWQGSRADVYAINADGTGLTNLTRDRHGQAWQFAWSPDGARIAFVADGDIWLMNADGTGQTPVVTTTLDDLSPVWSPDGTKIAFVSQPVVASD